MKNWSGTFTFSTDRVQRPRTLDELRAILARAPQVRVTGSRHSFTGIGDAAELVSLDALPSETVVEDGTVTCSSALTYAALAESLDGWALHNMASLPHISVGGSVATATHGSGVGNGNLATAVAGLELVTSDGDVVRARRGDPDFAGMVVGLGALGAVTRLTLDVEPAYEVRQVVFEGLGWDAFLEHFDAVMGAAYSVSVFTRWDELAGQVWIKSRGDLPEALLDARPATVERHPILELDPAAATAQLGVPGPWHARLPHFRFEFTPSAGEEIQSEFFVARADGPDAVRAVREIGDEIRDALLVSELRTIAADSLWMSPQHGQDTLALHFTWKREPEAVARAVDKVEGALAPLSPRPHWGKVFHTPAAYERADDFAALAARLDPRGAFRNDWLNAALGPRT